MINTEIWIASQTIVEKCEGEIDRLLKHLVEKRAYDNPQIISSLVIVSTHLQGARHGIMRLLGEKIKEK